MLFNNMTDADTGVPKQRCFWGEVAQWQTLALQAYLWFDSRTHHQNYFKAKPPATLVRHKKAGGFM